MSTLPKRHEHETMHLEGFISSVGTYDGQLHLKELRVLHEVLQYSGYAKAATKRLAGMYPELSDALDYHTCAFGGRSDVEKRSRSEDGFRPAVLREKMSGYEHGLLVELHAEGFISPDDPRVKRLRMFHDLINHYAPFSGDRNFVRRIDTRYEPLAEAVVKPWFDRRQPRNERGF